MSLRVRDLTILLVGCAAALLSQVACGSGEGATVSVPNGAQPGTADRGSSPGALDAPPRPHDEAPPEPPPPASEDAGPYVPPAPVVTDEAITVGGLARSYVLVAPGDYDAARAYALVVAMHGDGGDGASMRAALRFEDASGRDAIVVYPNGRNNTWDLYSPPAVDKDVGFLVELVDALRARFTIDPARVFATGFSSGAFMASQMACRRPALFRGIAAHGGGAPAEPQDPEATFWEGTSFVRCAGQDHGVAALVVHGRDDGVVSWESGAYAARYWSTVNGCTGEKIPAAATLGALGCVAYDGCPAEMPVTFCTVPDLGHTVWAEAAKASWAFFASL